MTKCQGCQAESQLFLCNMCTDELQDLLTGLVKREMPADPPRDAPGWIQLLEEAALGQAKLGDPVRNGARPNHLDGDAELAACIGLFPDDDEPDLEKARIRRFQIARNKALLAGRFNQRAHDRLIHLQATIDDWLKRLDFGGWAWLAQSTLTVKAFWLSQHTDRIANIDGAGRCLRDIRRHVTAIETIINRPPPYRFCGPCPNCDIELRAPHDAIEVLCRDCGVIHDIDELQNALWRRLADRLVTYPQLCEICRRTGEPVPVRSTLYKWIDQHRLDVRGYQRQDARRRIGPVKHSDNDQPVYRLGDVRKLMADKPQRVTRQK